MGNEMASHFGLILNISRAKWDSNTDQPRIHQSRRDRIWAAFQNGVNCGDISFPIWARFWVSKMRSRSDWWIRGSPRFISQLRQVWVCVPKSNFYLLKIGNETQMRLKSRTGPGVDDWWTEGWHRVGTFEANLSQPIYSTDLVILYVTWD